jgi:xylulokinase
LTLLGIDIGTTHVKARAYDEAGRLVAEGRRATPTVRLPGGGAEYEAGALEEAALGATLEAVRSAGPPRAIGVASMGESGFLLGEDGTALAPAIAWFDGRTAPQAARWKDRNDAADLFARTGLHVTPLFTACKLEWLAEHEQDLFGRAAGWLGMSEYLVFCMTGERATEPSLAGRTMLYDIRAGGRWDEELCGLAGVPPGLLPPVRRAGTVIGGLTPEAAGKISAPPGTPVVVAGHDHICGAFGAGATGRGEIVDSMGTAEAALLTISDPPLDEGGHALGLPVGRHVLPERYYIAATLPKSGAVVERLRDVLGGTGRDLARWTVEAAGLPPGEGGVCLPPSDEDVGDARLVLTLANGTGPGHLLRAVLEGLTLEINHDLARAVAASGTRPTRITLVGGGAQSGLWAQLKADASNLPVRVVSDTECVARGAALLAGVGAGVYKNTDSVPPPDYEADLEPSGQHAAYERLYAEVHEPLRARLEQPGPFYPV